MKKTITKYKQPLIALVLVVILLAGYFTREKWMSIFTKKSSDSSSNSNGSTNTNSTSTPTVTTSIDRNAVLANGSRGAAVEELQRLLNADVENHTVTILDNAVLTPLVVDGVFGSKTEVTLEFVTRMANAIKGTGTKSISLNQFVAAHTH